MALFDRMHDLSPFAGEPDKRGQFDHVKYDAKRRLLIASDRSVLIAVPVEGNSAPDAMIPASALRDAIKTGGSKVQLELGTGKNGKPVLNDSEGRKVLDALPAGDARYPDVFNHFPKEKPGVIVPIGAGVMKRLAEYAIKHRLGDDDPGIYLGLYLRDTEHGFQIPEKVIRVFMATGDNKLVTGAAGLFDTNERSLAETVDAALAAERGKPKKKAETEKPAAKPPAKPAATTKSAAAKPPSKKPTQAATPSKPAKPVSAKPPSASGLSFDDLIARARDSLKKPRAGYRVHARRFANEASRMPEASKAENRKALESLNEAITKAKPFQAL